MEVLGVAYPSLSFVYGLLYSGSFLSVLAQCDCWYSFESLYQIYVYAHSKLAMPTLIKILRIQDGKVNSKLDWPNYRIAGDFHGVKNSLNLNHGEFRE